MRRILAAMCLSVAAILVLPPPVQAQTADPPSPVSLDRIRAALTAQQPPLLRVPAPTDETATFRVEVRKLVLDLPPLDEQPVDLTYGLPSAGELLMGGFAKIRSAIVNYRRGRVERRARQEVEEALAAFFAYNNVPRSTTSATEK